MTRRRSFKRLVRSRMAVTGETYTAASSGLRGPDAPAHQPEQGEPTVENVHPRSNAVPSPLEGTSIPILPARDIPETLALFERLGFTVRHDVANGYAMVRRGAIELHFTATPDHDPRTSAGMTFVRLDDVSSLYEEFRATGAVPLTGRGWPPQRAPGHMGGGGGHRRHGADRRPAVGHPSVPALRPEQQPHPVRAGAGLRPRSGQVAGRRAIIRCPLRSWRY